MYLRGFVPEGQIGDGQDRTAGARLSRFESQRTRSKPSFRASIPQATFTPENTYFRDDRVKQVVGVKLQLEERHRLCQTRHAADGEILVQRRHLARRPRK